MRIRHAGRHACTNMNARMPTTASGYSSAAGAHTNAIRARTLIASTQNVAPGIGLDRAGPHRSLRGALMKWIVVAASAAAVTAKAIRLPSAIPCSR